MNNANQAPVAAVVPPLMEVDQEGRAWFVLEKGMTMEDAFGAGAENVRVAEGVVKIILRIPFIYHRNQEFLKRIKLSKTVERIGHRAFEDCRNLESVEIPSDSKLREIERRAFLRCSSLISITLPASLEELCGFAFALCKSLASVVIRGDNDAIHPPQLRIIEAACFWQSSSLVTFEMSHLRLLTDIGDHAFNGCSSLKCLVLPPSVRSIGCGAFQNCKALTNVTLTNVRGIFTDGRGFSSAFAFENCSSLTTVRFESVDALHAALLDGRVGSAFGENCPALSKMDLPEKVKIPVAMWPALIPELGWENGGLAGPDSTPRQQLSLVFDFLRPRMDTMVILFQ